MSAQIMINFIMKSFYKHLLWGEIDMEVQIFIKGKKEPLVYRGDRIDVLDFEMDDIKYKQIRYFNFKKGMSKSEFIQENLINKIVENI